MDNKVTLVIYTAIVFAAKTVYNKLRIIKWRYGMREVTGYYDGNTVQLMEPAPKTKQKVIVTFIDDEDVLGDLPVGILSKYADSEKRKLEEGAFERAMVEKHGNG